MTIKNLKEFTMPRSSCQRIAMDSIYVARGRKTLPTVFVNKLILAIPSSYFPIIRGAAGPGVLSGKIGSIRNVCANLCRFLGHCLTIMCAMVKSRVFLGMVIPPLIGILIMGI